MIVDSACYRAGRRHEMPVDHDVLTRLRDSPGHGADFVWLGLHEPDRAEMQRVQEQFGLPALAVEDALNDHQRPKLEPYADEDVLFLVVRTLWYVDATDQVESGQVAIFLGRDFVVTVRQGSGISLTSVREDLESRAEVLAHGPSSVVYAVCDRVVDGYQDVVEELETDVDEVETSVFSPGRSNDEQRIYVLKRELLEMRRTVHPLKAPVDRFAAGSYGLVHPDSAPFWRDVADHLTRAAEAVEALDALLSTAFEVHLARIGNQQNDDMRKISAWVAIAGANTLIAGVYGMNFEHMPELGWRFGYAWALGLMVVSGVLLHRLFKRSGWL